MVQVDKVYENIYRIGVPLAGNPLKELNSYFIKGEKFDLLIDTGFRTAECEAALSEGLEQLGSDPARRHLAITHRHNDHASMGDIFVGPGCPLYGGTTDMNLIIEAYKGNFYSVANDTEGFFKSQGYTDEMLYQISKTSPSSIFGMKADGLDIHMMSDGDVIDMGNFKLEWLVVPGHTPGNSMLWDAEHQIMFTGDHVLFDITPNITAWRGVEDSLGNYLDNLDKAYKYPVKLALPGHRKTGDYHERIRTIIAHHHRRLNEAYSVIASNPGLCTIEIAGKMTWKIRCNSWEDFPLVQKYFAVGECQSHLDFMRKRGLVTREKDGAVWRYTVVPGSSKPFDD